MSAFGEPRLALTAENTAIMKHKHGWSDKKHGCCWTHCFPSSGPQAVLREPSQDAGRKAPSAGLWHIMAEPDLLAHQPALLALGDGDVVMLVGTLTPKLSTKCKDSARLGR